MADVTFEAIEAKVWFCPVCGDRFIGGIHEVDQATHEWMNLHGFTHQWTTMNPSQRKLVVGNGSEIKQ